MNLEDLSQEDLDMIEKLIELQEQHIATQAEVIEMQKALLKERDRKIYQMEWTMIGKSNHIDRLERILRSHASGKNGTY